MCDHNVRCRIRRKGVKRQFFVYLLFDGRILGNQISQNPTFKFEVFLRVFRAFKYLLQPPVCLLLFILILLSYHPKIIYASYIVGGVHIMPIIGSYYNTYSCPQTPKSDDDDDTTPYNVFIGI